MISINFQPFNKSMTEVIEYMEKLEVLEATEKQSGTVEVRIYVYISVYILS